MRRQASPQGTTSRGAFPTAFRAAPHPGRTRRPALLGGTALCLLLAGPLAAQEMGDTLPAAGTTELDRKSVV